MWTNRNSTQKIAPGTEKYDLEAEEILTAQDICHVRSAQMYLYLILKDSVIL